MAKMADLPIYGKIPLKPILQNQKAYWTEFSYEDSLRQVSQNLYKILLGHMTKMTDMPIYGENHLKTYFSRARRSMTLVLGM